MTSINNNETNAKENPTLERSTISPKSPKAGKGKSKNKVSVGSKALIAGMSVAATIGAWGGFVQHDVVTSAQASTSEAVVSEVSLVVPVASATAEATATATVAATSTPIVATATATSTASASFPSATLTVVATETATVEPTATNTAEPTATATTAPTATATAVPQAMATTKSSR